MSDMPSMGPTELIIIAVVIILLFGAKRMPDAARSLGRSMRIFKAETKDMRDREEGSTEVPSTNQQQPAPQQPLPPASNAPANTPSEGTMLNGQPLSDPEPEKTQESR
jgi:sec-independent protein translocase protein TatA